MFVYRITTVKWAGNLTGSGYPARWNPNGVFMLYTASSRALACLENLVHRSGEGLHHHFRTVVLKVSDSISRDKITIESLPVNWHTKERYSHCQSIGKRWIDEKNSCMLEVPSAIIPEENNFLFDPSHPDFHYVKIDRIEDFLFDPRLK